ncbi:MAG: hypothetical protein H0W71_07065 [Sphingomonas sp.]|nr:hypothetical protein [Sphingomonas sp.]
MIAIRNTRSSLGKIAGAGLLVLLAGDAATQPVRHDEGQVLTITVPQFVVQAISFTALDETGWDWTGSDEVHAVFVDINSGHEDVTPIYDDVNAGETRSFSDGGACIAPQPGCSTGSSRLHFGVALWESDFSLTEWVTGCYATVVGRHPLYDGGICPGDDLIGRFELNFSRIQLLGEMPEVGGSIERKAQPLGGSGSYRVNYRITRQPDLRKQIVIGGGRTRTP